MEHGSACVHPMRWQLLSLLPILPISSAMTAGEGNLALSHICRRAPAGDAAEDSAGHQARAASVVVVVEPSDDLAGREEAGNGRAGGVLHLGVVTL